MNKDKNPVTPAIRVFRDHRAEFIECPYGGIDEKPARFDIGERTPCLSVVVLLYLR
jgi:hypothetical protein